MWNWIVQRDCPIKMRARLHKVPYREKGGAHKPMPDPARDRCSLLLGECQKLRCNIA